LLLLPYVAGIEVLDEVGGEGATEEKVPRARSRVRVWAGVGGYREDDAASVERLVTHCFRPNVP